MTRDEFRNALKNLIEDSCDLPADQVVEALENAVLWMHEIERFEATPQRQS